MMPKQLTLIASVTFANDAGTTYLKVEHLGRHFEEIIQDPNSPQYVQMYADFSVKMRSQPPRQPIESSDALALGPLTVAIRSKTSWGSKCSNKFHHHCPVPSAMDAIEKCPIDDTFEGDT
ncbi:hypothetical protein V6N13_065205 [Hibiscus sabdariffa]